jgi:hypothetical protein
MLDAFNQHLNIGDIIIGITNMSPSYQTLSMGKVINFFGDIITVEMDTEDPFIKEKRNYLSHRIAKI